MGALRAKLKYHYLRRLFTYSVRRRNRGPFTSAEVARQFET